MDMSTSKWENEYTQDPAPEVAEMKTARALWVCYFAMLELNDKKICSGERDGIAYPKNERERKGVRDSAQALRSRVMDLAEQYDISHTTMQMAGATVRGVTDLCPQKLKTWMQQEEWDKTVLPLLDLNTRRPGNESV